jgi:hypothetical protein
LLEFVDMIEQRGHPHRAQLIIQFHSPLNEFSRRENAQKHIARYSDYAPLLARAIDRARALQYVVKDLQDPTGVPALCVLDAQSRYLGALVSQRSRPRFHRWESQWLMRVDACKACDLADACMGIPRAYVELHGDGEFHAVHLPRSARTSLDPVERHGGSE